MTDPRKVHPACDRALERLIAGNRRYVTSTQTHPHQTSERCAELRNGQHPFGVILGCSDSRVPPEVIFDQGLGDLFVASERASLSISCLPSSIRFLPPKVRERAPAWVSASRGELSPSTGGE